VLILKVFNNNNHVIISYNININTCIEVPTVLCCNKIDKKRIISEDEGRQYANVRGLTYFETSAATGSNVNEMFDYLFQSVLYRIKQ
jgi:GTPase SAR1 family protein